jgi:predicted DNA-binding transcriptional regulator AlpA
MNVPIETKAVVTVSEMARMCCLSRSRFYQLIGSAFPSPLMDKKKRPFYSEELQAVCLEVRRRNCGIDGKPILFYARRIGTALTKPKKVKAPATINPKHADLLEGVRSLGIASVTAADIDKALKEVFPSGVENQDDGEILRVVFLHLKRKNRADKVGR